MGTTGIGRRRLLAAGLGVAGLATTAGCGTRTSKGRETAVGAATTAPTTSAGAEVTATEIDHGPRTRDEVALTFHGQGEPAMLGALLDTVERAGGRVTVLAVGSWLAAQPDLARRIRGGGHDLGNHTQNHLALASMPAAAVHREIDECAQVLHGLTGGIGTWFRPSRTARSTAVIRAQAAAVGYRTCLGYDVDSLDYTDPGPAAIVETTLRGVLPGSVVSLHCGHPGTVAAMPALLAGLADRGLRPVTATTLLAP